MCAVRPDRSPVLTGGFGDGFPTCSTQSPLAFVWCRRNCHFRAATIEHLSELDDLSIYATFLGFETLDGGLDNVRSQFLRGHVKDQHTSKLARSHGLAPGAPGAICASFLRYRLFPGHLLIPHGFVSYRACKPSDDATASAQNTAYSLSTRGPSLHLGADWAFREPNEAPCCRRSPAP